jgi:hypothetical protein
MHIQGVNDWDFHYHKMMYVKYNIKW